MQHIWKKPIATIAAVLMLITPLPAAGASLEAAASLPGAVELVPSGVPVSEPQQAHMSMSGDLDVEFLPGQEFSDRDNPTEATLVMRPHVPAATIRVELSAAEEVHLTGRKTVTVPAPAPDAATTLPVTYVVKKAGEGSIHAAVALLAADGTVINTRHIDLQVYATDEGVFHGNRGFANLKLKHLEKRKREGTVTEADVQQATMQILMGEPQSVTAAVVDLVDPDEIVVEGYAYWFDPYQDWHPIRQANVFVRLYTPYGSVVKSVACITADDGYYTVRFGSVTEAVLVQVEVYAEGNLFRVAGSSVEGSWGIWSQQVSVSTGRRYMLSPLTATTETDNGKAFPVYDATLTGYLYTQTLDPTAAAKVDDVVSKSGKVFVKYPGSGSAVHPPEFGSPRWIEIDIGDAWDWDVNLHEFGHYLAAVLQTAKSPGGYHVMGINLSENPFTVDGSGPVRGKDAGTRVAWSEGWASYFAISGGQIMQVPGPSIWRDTSYNDMDWVKNTHNSQYTANGGLQKDLDPINSNNGEDNELTVAQVLWDLYDSNTPAPGDVEQETISLPPDKLLFNGTINLQRLSDAYKHLIQGVDQRTKMQINQVFEENGIAPKPDPLAMQWVNSTSQPSLGWETNGGGPRYRSNEFVIRVYDNSDPASDLQFRVEVPAARILNSPPLQDRLTWTPSPSEWNQVLGVLDTARCFTVVGWNAHDGTETGPYESQCQPFYPMRLRVSEKNLKLQVNEAAAVTVEEVYGDNAAIDRTGDSTVTWTIGDTNIIQRLNGKLVAKAEGSTYVDVEFRGAKTRISVTVGHTEVRPIDRQYILRGEGRQFTAVFKSGASEEDISNQVVWSTGNSLIAAVEAGGGPVIAAAGTMGAEAQATSTGPGYVTGVGIGSTTVTALFNGVPATVTGNVTVATLSLSPATSTLAAGNSVQLAATYNEASGDQTVTSSVTWESSNSQIATVSTGGRVTGIGAGTAQIIGRYRGMARTAQVSVTCAAGTYFGCATELIPGTATSGNVSGTKTMYYKLPVTEGGSYTVKLTPTSGDPSMDLRAPDLSLLASSALYRTTEKISFTAATTGDYYIVVYAASSAYYSVTATATTLSSISTSASSASLLIGESKALTATAYYANGESASVTGYATWTSDNPAVATVSSTGLVQPVAEGTARVTVALGGKSKIVTISVLSVRSVTITTNPVKLPKGFYQNLSAKANLSDGSTRSISTGITWASDNTQVASMSGNRVTGVNAGTTTVRATYMGLTGTATVVVLLPQSMALSYTSTYVGVNEYLNLDLVATYEGGITRSVDTKASWASSNGAIVTVSSGDVRGVARGTATVTATYEGLTASVQVTVATVSAFSVTPTSVTLVYGGDGVQLVGKATFYNGPVVDVSDVATWTSSNPAAADVSAGWVWSNDLGSTTITAAYGGRSATSSVKVKEMADFVVVPGTSSIALGSGTQMVATAKFLDGTSTSVTSRTNWVSYDPWVAEVSEGGYVTALTPGTATISGSFEGWYAETTITVTCPAGSGKYFTCAISLGSTAVTGTVKPGESKFYKFAATAGQSYSLELVPTSGDPALWVYGPGPDWPYINGSVNYELEPETVTFYAETTGDHFVEVESYAETDTQYTLRKVTLSSVSIKGPSTLVSQDEGVQLEATATYSNGSTLDVTCQAEWTSSNPNVADVDPWCGYVRGIAAGTATIKATFEGKTASYSVTVGGIKAVTITPASVTLNAGAPSQLTAKVSYTNTTSTKTVNALASWNSSDWGVAEVSETGLVTAVAPGVAEITADYMGYVGRTTVTVSCTNGAYFTCALSLGSAASGTVADNQSVFYKFSTTVDYRYLLTMTHASGDVDLYAYDSNQYPRAPADEVGDTREELLFTSREGGYSYAEVYGFNGPSTYSLTVGSIASLSIAGTTTLEVGGDSYLTATATYGNGVTEDLTCDVTWTTSNPQVANVDNCGWVTGGRGGTATITAHHSGKSVSRTVTVTAVLERIEVAPNFVNLKVGGSADLVATAYYNDGTTKPVTSSSTWESQSPAVATVSGGRVSARALGDAIIIARYQGYEANAFVSVNNLGPTPTGLRLEAAGPVYRDQKTEFDAVLVYDDGSETEVSGAATWSSSSTGIATVSSGVVTGEGAGTVTITASYSTFSKSLTVSVLDVTGLAIEPYTATLAPLAQLQLVVLATYADGAVFDVTTDEHATWGPSPDPLIATVRQGLVTAGGRTGIVKLTVTYEGRTANIYVSVECISDCQIIESPSDPVPLEPEVTEPKVTEPEATEPEVTEPEVTEPEVTEPEVTEPEVTEPEVTEPEVTEPEVTEPEVTEPKTPEPDTTEQVTTQVP